MVTLELPLSGGAMALFWFVGVHGPSIVEPAIAAIIYANVEANLQSLMKWKIAELFTKLMVNNKIR